MAARVGPAPLDSPQPTTARARTKGDERTQMLVNMMILRAPTGGRVALEFKARVW